MFELYRVVPEKQMSRLTNREHHMFSVVRYDINDTIGWGAHGTEDALKRRDKLRIKLGDMTYEGRHMASFSEVKPDTPWTDHPGHFIASHYTASFFVCGYNRKRQMILGRRYGALWLDIDIRMFSYKRGNESKRLKETATDPWEILQYKHLIFFFLLVSLSQVG